jgi:radical SAM superfamily enzyme YgiQ (UPF0313 family)
MPEIVLATLNAKYAHSAFGLRYLLANLGELRERAVMLEGTIDERPVDFVEKILALAPSVVGLSVYIWNATQSLEIVRVLKRVQPELMVVLGGPEVSYEHQNQEIVSLADYLVIQEGELAFRELCQQLLDGQRPEQRILRGGQPKLDELQLPYALYSDHDLAHRVIYVEASRGCPFRCEFCLSSLDAGVRHWPIERLLEVFADLLERGARQFKFIDRTFNLRIEVGRAILGFFLERYTEGLFLHFEMVPDRFPQELRELVSQFPEAAVQFEVGIQSFDPEVQKRISRRQNNALLEDNLRFLRAETGVHVHADLIVGLPGESLALFALGFDRLVGLGPQEIQVGILKRLRGTPIIRHDQEYAMVYSPSPPYEVLSTGAIPFTEMMRAKRFARYWDMVANRGNFPQTLPLLLGSRPFDQFMAFSDWLFTSTGATHKIGLPRLAELLFDYLLVLGVEVAVAATALVNDYTRDSQRYVPPFLLTRLDVPPELLRRPKALRAPMTTVLPSRQAKHLLA